MTIFANVSSPFLVIRRSGNVVLMIHDQTIYPTAQPRLFAEFQTVHGIRALCISEFVENRGFQRRLELFGLSPSLAGIFEVLRTIAIVTVDVGGNPIQAFPCRFVSPKSGYRDATDPAIGPL